jgi:serine/threonine protein kinase
VLRSKREFRSVAELNHPNSVKVYDLGRSKIGWFLTMKYIAGVDLMTYLGAQEDDGCLQRMAASRQLASGVHALHRAGMLHRDLKPSNVLVADERVIAFDIGLVRAIAAESAAIAADDAVVGTPDYMAPEPILAGEFSQATDWYAFGVMLYEAISGLPPFEGSLRRLLQPKVHSDPQPLTELAPNAPAQLSQLRIALLSRTAGGWPEYERSVSVLAPQSKDLRASKLPAHLTEPVIAGLQARLAFLAGDRTRTAQLLREHNELCQQVSSLNEATLGKYALGRVLADAAGEAMCRKAEQTLRDLGFVHPPSVLPLHFPELV